MIRTARPEDAAGVQAIYGPEVTNGTASFETEPPSVGEMARRITVILPTYPWLVWEEAGRILGYAYASRHRDREAYRWSIDTAVYVAAEGRGRGVALNLYRRLFEITRRQGFHAAFAGVAIPNPASEALHRAAGFSLIGVYPEVGYKHGAWRDVGWWRRPLTPASGAPAEPIPFGSLETSVGRPS